MGLQSTPRPLLFSNDRLHFNLFWSICGLLTVFALCDGGSALLSIAPVLGGIPHRSAQDIVWDLTLRLEEATRHGRFFGGFSLDSEKFFDNVTWSVIFPLAEYVGFPKAVSTLLQNYLRNLKRYFRYGPSAGQYWTCTNSIVQGCVISLILVAIQASLWAHAVLDASPHAIPTSYVDDKQVSGRFPSDVAKAAQASLEVSVLLAEKVNVKKSAAFANSKHAQQQLQEVLPAGFTAPFVTTEKVLGALSLIHI